ncbi:unnamed protein product [Lepeophtheirus salmonis]|uniref:(salmon louse) hypothetical protein n=1 Tax=Lepeophtheirus salmonis TaxID=72036 RepID=A0A7R8CX50_LEPSM|nr:unnamed protein product [Lepeophtheirus salmonis]CAF2911841.1 unnamed protein product [Lepeophtheirus salmonis]
MRVYFIIWIITISSVVGKRNEEHNLSLNAFVSRITEVNPACSIFIVDLSFENPKINKVLENLQEEFRVVNYQSIISSWINSMEILHFKTCVQTLVFGSKDYIVSFFKEVWDRALTNDPYQYFAFVNSLSDVHGIEALMDILHIAIVILPSSNIQSVVNVYQVNPYAYEKFPLVNIWSNKRSDFIKKFKLQNNDMNLMGYNLKVAYMMHPPFLFQISPIYVNGIEKQMVDILGKSIGYNTELIKSIDGKWGEINQNGSWNGIIGMAQRKEVYVAIGSLTRQFQREVAIDFTLGYSESYLTFITHVPQELPKWHSLLWPFEKYLWYLVLITMVFFSLCFIAILYVHERNKIQLSLAFINIWGSFFKQGIVHPKGTSLRIILGTWFLCSFCIVASYGGSLVSYLSRTNMEKPIDTLEELAGSDLNLLLIDGTFYSSLFEVSKDTTYKSIGRKLNQASEKGYKCVGHLNCLKTVNGNKEIVYITDGGYFTEFYPKAHDLKFVYLSKSKFYTSEYAIVLRKNFPILKHFNQKIQRFLEMGLIDKWKRDFSQRYIVIANEKDKKKQCARINIEEKSMSGHFLQSFTREFSRGIYWIGIEFNGLYRREIISFE